MKLLVLPLASTLVAFAAMMLDPSNARADQTSTATIERPPALDAPITPFGSRGQLALDDLTGIRLTFVTSGNALTGYGTSGILTYATSSTTGPYPAEGARTTIAFSPSLDYFVADHVSIGGSFGLGYSQIRSASLDGTGAPSSAVSSGFGVTFEPRIGYVLRIAGDVILWPRVGFGYDVARSSQEGNDGIHSLQRTLRAQGELGVIFRAGKYFYVNVGPRIAFGKTLVSSTVGWNTATTAFGGGANLSLGLIL